MCERQELRRPARLRERRLPARGASAAPGQNNSTFSRTWFSAPGINPYGDYRVAVDPTTGDVVLYGRVGTAHDFGTGLVPTANPACNDGGAPCYDTFLASLGRLP